MPIRDPLLWNQEQSPWEQNLFTNKDAAWNQPFSQQQAMGAINTPQFQQSLAQLPQPAMSPQERELPQAGWGQNLNTFLGSPGFTMASAALQNLGNSAPNSRGRQVDPVAAMQEAQRKNEVLQQRRAQILDNQRQTAQMREYRALQMQQMQAQLDAKPERKMFKGANGKNYYTDTLTEVLPDVSAKPSAFMEKAGLYAQTLGFDKDDPASWVGDSRMQDFIRNSGSAVNVDVNTAPKLADLAGFDSKAAKDDFRANLTGIPDLMNISNQFKDDYLTTMGQARRKVTAMRDRGGLPVGPEEKKDLAEYTQFTNNVEQQFNAYRKLITGAAGSPSELESLRSSIENLDQGPTAFRASLDNRMENQARQLRGAIYLEAKGDTQMGTPEMGERLAKRSADKFMSEEVQNTVGDYIAVSLGFDPDNLTGPQGTKVKQQLIRLGFFKE